MDIHRCRFVPYPSSAINALAFTHPSPARPPSSKALPVPPKALRLAVGRANGNIELWNPHHGAWVQESILLGGKDRSIEGLVWTQDPDDIDGRGNKIIGQLRLFSVGYSDAITEWNIAEGKPLRHTSSNHGEIWCIAAQPRDQMPQKDPERDDQEHTTLVAQAQRQNIAVGCADGSIVLLSTDDKDLHFNKIVARPGSKRPRVLSIAFKDRYTIVAGHADSTLRVYDIRGGQTIRNISLGGGVRGGPKETLIWAVKCLTNGDIVAGDSTGTVSFIDGKHYSLLQRIKSHEADVLELAVSRNGRSVFSGGMDRRTVLYQNASGESKRNRWAKVSHDRQHKNDVKAMATFEAKKFSVLASGGLDTWPMITPIQGFGKENHRALPTLPQSSVMTSSGKRRLMMCYWEREISIWSIRSKQEQRSPQDVDWPQEETVGRRLLSKMMLQGDEYISSVSISANGNLLVVSTTAKIKFFQLRLKQSSLKVKSLSVPGKVSGLGAKIVQISPDGQWLAIVTPQSVVKLLELVEKKGVKPVIEVRPDLIPLKRLPRSTASGHAICGSLGKYDRTVNRAEFSSDGKILAVGDLSGFLDTWVLEDTKKFEQEKIINGNRKGDGLSSNSRSESGTGSDIDSADESDSQCSLSPSDSSSDAGGSSNNRDRRKPRLGPHWIRNPTANLLPRLDNAALVLSFRPSSKLKSHALTDSDREHSHIDTEREDRLLIVTADNAVREFHVLTGKLSDWSRRNPPECLPDDYQDLKDRVKGLLWDKQHPKDRIWLYGVNWLFMLDISRDLPSKTNANNTLANRKATPNGAPKRKRELDDESGDERKRRRKQDTGAGSRIPDHMLKSGVGRKIQKIEGTNSSEPKLITMNDEEEEDDGFDDEADLELSSDGNLLRLRRGKELNGIREDEESLDLEEFEEATDGDGGKGQKWSTEDKYRRMRQKERKKGNSMPYWHTHKYRPIVGIVPISEGDGSSLEVALVERPDWEMDLPAKYKGEQEWNP